MARRKSEPSGSTANLGFEEKLWAAADKMRGHMDAAEYKHVALGLIFKKIADTYHAWRGEKGCGTYADISGFSKSTTTAEIAEHGHVLTPGRYVGAEAVEEDGEPFAEKMARLTATLKEQFAESAKLEKAILKNLEVLGYGG